MKKSSLLAMLLTLPLIGGAAGCGGSGGGEPPSQEQEKPVPVKVEESATGLLEDRIDLPGRIEAFREVTVSAEVGGLLEWRGVEEGDAVAAGAKLAVIDREGLELKERQAVLALEQSRIAVEQASVAVRQAEAGLEGSAAGERQGGFAVSQSEEQLRKARAMYEESERDLERGRSLFEEQLAPRSGVDELEMAVEAASADLAAAEKGVEAAGAAEEAVAAGRKAAEAAVEAAKEQLAAARSRVKSAEARLEEARLFLRRSTILSPIEGFVDKTFSEKGELVKAQDPLFRLLQVVPVKAVFHLAEKDVPFLEAGMAAQVTVEALSPDPLTGEVDLIGIASDPGTSTYRLEVRLPNGDGRLRPGMLARLRLVRKKVEEALSVPVFAVVNDNGADYLYLYDGGSARRRAVVTGIVDGDRVQITAGLTAGEKVIVKGQRDLDDGQRVTVP